MSNENPLSSKVVLDTSDYKAGVAELNRQIRVIESGFKAAAASMDDWTKSSSGLESRIKSLTEVIGLQRTKVDGLQGVYDELAAGGKASARELQELQIKINNETTSLNKLETELKQSKTALNEMGDETNRAGNEMKELEDKTKRAAERMEKFKRVAGGIGKGLKVGAVAIAGLATAAAGAAVAIGGMVVKAADLAGELVDTSEKTGVSIQKLQEYAYVGEQIGVSTDTITGSLAKLIRNMNMASDGTGEQAEAFEKLKINVTNADGSLRDSQTVFQEVLGKLGQMTNETERDAIAMTLMGKSAQELNPLIKTSASEMAAMVDEAHKLGAVMKDEDVIALEAFGDTLASLKAGLKGTLGTLASAFLPAFQGMANQAKTYLGEFSEIVRGADGDLGKMAEGVGGLLGKIVTDVAANAPKMMKAGLSIIQGILTAITSNLPVLIPGAVSIVTSLVQFLLDNLPMMTGAATDLVLALIAGLLPQLPMLVDVALQMLVTLADGLTKAAPTLIPVIADVVAKIVQVILDNLPLVVDAALALVLALTDGLIASLPVLIETAPVLIESLVSAILEMLPAILEAAVLLISALAKGLIENLPLLIKVTFDLINAVIDAFRKTDWGKMGKNLIDGIAKGVSEQWKGFVENFLDNIDELVNAVKKLLGIKSPSKVFAGIGSNMALGLGKGFEGAFAGIADQVNGMIGSLAMSPSLAMGTSMAGPPSNSPLKVGGNESSIIVNATVASDIDIHKLARKVAEEIKRGKK